LLALREHLISHPHLSIAKNRRQRAGLKSQNARNGKRKRESPVGRAARDAVQDSKAETLEAASRRAKSKPMDERMFTEK